MRVRASEFRMRVKNALISTALLCAACGVIRNFHCWLVRLREGGREESGRES